MTQFAKCKTLFLELSRIKINYKENIKDFNKRFTTLLNKILYNPIETMQIELYTSALLTPISMFVKRKEK